MPVLTDDESDSSESEDGAATPPAPGRPVRRGEARAKVMDDDSSAGSSSDASGSASAVAAWHLRGQRSQPKTKVTMGSEVASHRGPRQHASPVVLGSPIAANLVGGGHSDGSSSSSSSSRSRAAANPPVPKHPSKPGTTLPSERAGRRRGKDRISPQSVSSGASSVKASAMLTGASRRGKAVLSPKSMASGASTPKSAALLSATSSPKSLRGGRVRVRLKTETHERGQEKENEDYSQKKHHENEVGLIERKAGKDIENITGAAGDDDEDVCRKQREAEALGLSLDSAITQPLAREAEEELNRKQKEEQQRLALEEERRNTDLLAAEARRKEGEAAERKRLEIEAERMKAQQEAQELRNREAALISSLTPEEADRLRGMMQAYTLYQQQLFETDRAIASLRNQIGKKTKLCQAMRRKTQQASQDTKRACDREAVQSQEVVKWEKKRLQFNEEGQPVGVLRNSYGVLDLEVKRVKEEAQPLQVQRKELRQRLEACEKSSRESARQLTDLRPASQREGAELKAEQLAELANLRAQHTEHLAQLDAHWQDQLGDLKAMLAEESSTLKADLEETSRRRDRLRQERHEASEQLCARQREGARLQQQCADARQEVLELQAHLKTAVPMATGRSGRHAGLVPSLSTSSLLDLSTCTSSAYGASRHPRALDMELGDLGNRCRSLERECAKMHSALEKGHEIHAKWRRRGLGRAAPRSEAKRSGALGPFALGPPEERSSLSDLVQVVEQPWVGNRTDSAIGSRPNSP